MSELGEIRRDIDRIGRKMGTLIDVLLGRPVKLKPIDLDDAAIAALNAAPGKVAAMPEGERYPHGLPSDDDVYASICAHTKAMDDIYQARNKWMQDHANRGCRTSKHDGELAAAEAQAKLNRLLADVACVRGESQPEAITTELECAGIDQYAIEIEMAGRRVRYEAPSVDGVRDLMRMNHEHGSWVEFENARAEFEQAQIDRAAEKFEAEKQRAA